MGVNSSFPWCVDDKLGKYAEFRTKAGSLCTVGFYPQVHSGRNSVALRRQKRKALCDRKRDAISALQPELHCVVLTQESKLV